MNGVAVKLDGALAGMPDYLMLLPGGRCWLVEFKATDGALSPRQIYVHEQLAAIGHPVSVIRDYSVFTSLLDAMLAVK